MSEEGIIWRVRSWMNEGPGRWVAVAAAAAVIAGAAWWFVRDRRDPELAKILARGRKTLYICKACQATGEVRISYDDRFPVRCPKCGKRAAVAGFRCRGCGKIIEIRENVLFECPHCHRQYDNRMPGIEELPEEAVPKGKP